MHVQTCENPVTVYNKRLAAIASATHFIHKLPLPFDIPLYVLLFSPFASSVVDLGFQYNHFPFLPVSGHCMPISYFHYLQTLLYPFSLSHICPSHNHKHQPSQDLDEHCFLKKSRCMGLECQPNAQNTTWSTRMSLSGTPLLPVQLGRPY